MPRDVDGVAVFVPQWFGPTEFIKRLARRVADPAREIVVGPAVVDEPEMLQATAPALAGVAGSSYVDPPRMRHHVRAYARAFPGASGAIARSEAVTSNSEAVEALLRAFERAHGDTDRLPAELARLRIDLLGGPVRLDKRRQAVVSTTLVRIEPQTGGGGAPRLTPLQRMHGVDQSIDGLLPPSLSPGARPLPCRPRAR